jgi:exonuclease SbcD
VIPSSDLPQEAVAVLSGHIHRQQVLASKSLAGKTTPPVVYPGSIERTSFAERDEKKGFYDIALVEVAKGNWRIEMLDFHELPARPMVDITLMKTLKPDDVADYVRLESSGMDPHSIVRIRCEPGTSPEVKQAVTSSLLREILPETMNHQFSAEFRV